jgi:hypothetical protein
MIHQHSFEYYSWQEFIWKHAACSNFYFVAIKFHFLGICNSHLNVNVNKSELTAQKALWLLLCYVCMYITKLQECKDRQDPSILHTIHNVNNVWWDNDSICLVTGHRGYCFHFFLRILNVCTVQYIHTVYNTYFLFSVLCYVCIGIFSNNNNIANKYHKMYVWHK